MAYRILICATDPKVHSFDPFPHGGTYANLALAKSHALLQAQELRPFMSVKVVRDNGREMAVYHGTIPS